MYSERTVLIIKGWFASRIGFLEIRCGMKCHGLRCVLANDALACIMWIQPLQTPNPQWNGTDIKTQPNVNHLPWFVTSYYINRIGKMYSFILLYSFYGNRSNMEMVFAANQRFCKYMSRMSKCLSPDVKDFQQRWTPQEISTIVNSVYNIEKFTIPCTQGSSISLTSYNSRY